MASWSQDLGGAIENLASTIARAPEGYVEGRIMTDLELVVACLRQAKIGLDDVAKQAELAEAGGETDAVRIAEGEIHKLIGQRIEPLERKVEALAKRVG